MQVSASPASERDCAELGVLVCSQRPDSRPSNPQVNGIRRVVFCCPKGNEATEARTSQWELVFLAHWKSNHPKVIGAGSTPALHQYVNAKTRLGSLRKWLNAEAPPAIRRFVVPQARQVLAMRRTVG